MIFYSVLSEDYTEHGVRYFATKAEALREAKAIAKGDSYATVHRVGLSRTDKASIIRLANQEGWASPFEEIWSNNK